jgi:hypothetical protein
MKRMMCLALFVGGCGSSETFQHRVAITEPPPMSDGEATTKLKVPTSCPVWAPGGGDVGTPEKPFPDNVTIMCVVDETGATYGIVGGDAPTARLAVIPGGREIGFFVAFAKGSGFSPARVTLTGDNPTLAAWAGPGGGPPKYNGSVVERTPANRLNARVVALSAQGMMVSLGRLGPKRVEVQLEFGGAAVPLPADRPVYGQRFVVDGQP